MEGARQEVLVGSTGFVGGNLLASHEFDCALHSSDVAAAYNGDNGLLLYAGVPSSMFLANGNPEADMELMRAARFNIQSINADKTVLISTIAVYSDSRGKTESDEPTFDGLSPYGRNRLQLEQWVRSDFPDALIVRLPALYGLGLKKNFIFDMMHIAPVLLADDRFNDLAASSDLVASSYKDEGNGFWKQKTGADRKALNAYFAACEFNALSFTDSRSRFQYYDLRRLWSDICIALDNDLRMLNVSTPPLSAAQIYKHIREEEWKNHLGRSPFDYDMRTEFAGLWNGSSGYIGTRQSLLDSLAAFVKEHDEEV